MIHVVDIYPTLAGLAGAATAKSKPLDGIDVWAALARASPRRATEIVYNVDPMRGGRAPGRLEAGVESHAAAAHRTVQP